MCKVVPWAVFQTHDLMEVFDVANFNNYPSISSEYIKFLADENVQKEMAGLLKQNKELKGRSGEA